MKKWFPIFLLPVAAALLLASSCKEKPDPPTYYIPDEYKLYTEFHPGSYWVYEDSASGALDSVYVLDYKEEMAELSIEDDDVIQYNEAIAVKYKSVFKSKDSFIQTIINCVHPDQVSTCYLTSRYLDGPGENGWFDLAAYPFKTGYMTGSTEQITDIYSTFQVDSLLFSNVIRTSVSNDYTEDGYQSYYYFARNAGIVRLESEYLPGSWRIWKLKRYNAIR